MEGGVQTQLGDAYGGETRRVVFALHVPSLPTLGPTTIGEVVRATSRSVSRSSSTRPGSR